MILYHGSNTEITEIDLSKCRPLKDFGQGFYTTAIREQAEKMAHRVARIYGGNPIVTSFEIADDFINTPGLNTKDFGFNTSVEWAKFVMNNRSFSFDDMSSELCNKDCKYDIVAGPVADDDMAVLFRQYENSMITFEMLVSGMTYKQLSGQYSFHTEQAIALLKKAGVIIL